MHFCLPAKQCAVQLQPPHQSSTTQQTCCVEKAGAKSRQECSERKISHLNTHAQSSPYALTLPASRVREKILRALTALGWPKRAWQMSCRCCKRTAKLLGKTDNGPNVHAATLFPGFSRLMPMVCGYDAVAMMMSSLSQSCAMAVPAIMHVSVMLEQQNPGTSHPGCWPELYLRSSQDLGNTLHLAAPNKAPWSGAVVVLARCSCCPSYSIPEHD